MKFKRIIFKVSTICLLLTMTPLNVCAAKSGESVEAPVAVQSEVAPQAHVKGYKYKMLNNRMWKRLWSYTYNKWLDPEWTLV